MASSAASAPRPFHVLAKPAGALCNLDCHYCYFLKKQALYPGSRCRMSDALLESYIRRTIQSQPGREAMISWQGGEPTLMGLGFFRRAVALAERYRRPGMRIRYTIQTNGSRINADWARFFREHDVLVGLSIDGPERLHDIYRRDRRGRGTFARVWRGLQHLHVAGAEVNILATVHAGNVNYPLDTYRFFRDEAGAKFIQFLPIVERAETTGASVGAPLTDRSVTGAQYGEFLVQIYDEWLRRDVGRVHVQMFEVTLGTYIGVPSSLCLFAPSCGTSVALEHNGDLDSSDHFVEPAHRLGNILQTPIALLVASPQQRRFGRDKQLSLPRKRQQCDVLALCYGGCPKDRTAVTEDGEPGLNHLCSGYRRFFRHADGSMRKMADLRRGGRSTAQIVLIKPEDDTAPLI